MRGGGREGGIDGSRTLWLEGALHSPGGEMLSWPSEGGAPAEARKGPGGAWDCGQHCQAWHWA